MFTLPTALHVRQKIAMPVCLYVYKGNIIQEYKSIRVHEYMSTRVQEYRSIKEQIFKFAITQVTRMQNYMGAQKYKKS